LDIAQFSELFRYQYVNLVHGSFSRKGLKIMEQGNKENVVYDPNQLLDALIRHLGLTSDGALSRKLNVARSVIKKIRHGHLPIGASMLMWMHEATGISINELRALMGDRRSKYRLNVARIG
jgi:transcriptional regulator with XRE-family HTH domain